MSKTTETPAERIAGDLALAIHQGLLRPGQRLPSQTELMHSYEVAMGTAASALAKLSAAGLTRVEPGRGTFVRQMRWGLEPDPIEPNPILEVMAAASMCRDLAGIRFNPDAGPPTLSVGGSPDWDAPHVDPEKVSPPRQVDVSTLVAVDRHVLRWMSEAFLAAARRMVGSGVVESDTHLIAAARSVLRRGGCRPQGQAEIAWLGGPQPWEEAVATRIWPERAKPPAEGEPPF